jgi:hypothetical protein
VAANSPAGRGPRRAQIHEQDRRILRTVGRKGVGSDIPVIDCDTRNLGHQERALPDKIIYVLHFLFQLEKVEENTINLTETFEAAVTRDFRVSIKLIEFRVAGGEWKGKEVGKA